MVSAGKFLQVSPPADVLFRELERRRSDRVMLNGGGLNVRIKGLGPARFLDLSLGGATLETTSRLTKDISHQVRIHYGGAHEEVTVRVYHSSLHELFYSTEGGSCLRCRAKAVFAEPSVAALNLLYRIMKEHWVEPWFDDTRPYPSEIDGSHRPPVVARLTGASSGA